MHDPRDEFKKLPGDSVCDENPIPANRLFGLNFWAKLFGRFLRCDFSVTDGLGVCSVVLRDEESDIRLLSGYGVVKVVPAVAVVVVVKVDVLMVVVDVTVKSAVASPLVLRSYKKSLL